MPRNPAPSRCPAVDAFPGLPRNLNPSNRPVRTRIPGCVAGDVKVNPSRPYADARAYPPSATRQDHLIRKSSFFALPPFVAAAIHRGIRPRPVQVFVGLAGSRYFAATLPLAFPRPNDIVEVELVEQLALVVLQPPHHGKPPPLNVVRGRNHCSTPTSTDFCNKIWESPARMPGS